MAGITRFDPFGELVRLDPLRDFEAAFRVPRAVWRDAPEVPEIRMDVSEDPRAYRVKAEIPGVKKEDIRVSIDGNQVSVGVEVRSSKEDRKGETILRSERYLGSRYRTFSLPQEVDEARAEARYEGGVLELVLPKKEGGGAKQLTVS
jgi:HSP20 family protein